MSGRVFSRATASPPVAVRAEGSTIWDADGRAYLDAAGGAIVVNVGHGRASIAEAMAAQAGTIAYAHGSTFTSEPLEGYAHEIGAHLPLDEPAIYPVSGGSEAIETALKLARAYHLARGEADRAIVIARWGSYHGNTLGALDLSGRRPLRRPYEPWLGRFRHVSAAYPYRSGDPGANALGSADELVAELDRTIDQAGPGTVAAFVAEPIVGATLAAVVPPDDYWPAIADVCRRHGVLLIADEVMTGFGRTGRWFGVDHWAVRPDILVAAKGASSGYWPFGFAAASGSVVETVLGAGAFVHGFTYSHHVVAAAVAREVLRILETESLVEAARVKGERLRALLDERLGGHPNVGEIRGRGLMVGVELVADRESREPYPRAARLTETIVRSARDAGLLLYSGTGLANGVDGDSILLGPPFVVTDDELVAIADGLTDAIASAIDAVAAAAGGLISVVLIDLSHDIHDGLVTYPGIPAPIISDVLSREASRERYAPGTEFVIGRIEMAGNTGTYVDTPFHRYPDGFDLAGLPLEAVVDVPVSLVSTGDLTSIEPDVLAGVELSGRAVLFHTGWSRHFGTPAYASGHPHLTTATVEALVAGRARLVGIDSLNIDPTSTGERPAHTGLLAAGIPIVEHLTNLDRLVGVADARFYAVPPKVRGLSTFPVRAFAMVEG